MVIVWWVFFLSLYLFALKCFFALVLQIKRHNPMQHNFQALLFVTFKWILGGNEKVAVWKIMKSSLIAQNQADKMSAVNYDK